MREHWLRQVQPHVLQGLALGFVDGHGKGWPHWELSASQTEWVCRVIADKLDSWDQHHLTHMAAIHNFGLQVVLGDVLYGSNGSIGFALGLVQVTDEHHWHANLQVELMCREILWGEGV